MSAEENVWRWSGGDWRIGHAHERGGSARDKTVSGASHLTFTLGAMSMAVKQYNVDLDRSIRTSHSLLWIHGHIGMDERVDQVFDSGLEDMDVLARLDADHAFSHP